MIGAAAGFWELGCSKTEADTGTGIRIGWFGLEDLAVSFSKGLQMILFKGRGDCLGAGTKF